MKYSIITLNSMMLVLFSKCGSHLLIIRTHLRTTMCSDSFFQTIWLNRVLTYITAYWLQENHPVLLELFNLLSIKSSSIVEYFFFLWYYQTNFTLSTTESHWVTLSHTKNPIPWGFLMVESSKTAKQRCSENSSILKIFGRNLVESQR